MDESLVRKGKRLAHCLRHSPETYGIVLDEAGAAPVSSVSFALNITMEELRLIVASDSKGRFIVEDGKIWATQGHSVPANVPLTEYASPAVLFHGTKQAFLEAILTEGLIPKTRNYVHLSLTEETAVSVASRRSGDSIILKIDAGAFLKDGGRLYRSANNVILSEHIPSKYITE